MNIYKKIVLTNSAVMPNDGNYTKKTISKNQFIKIIQNAEEIRSHVGYESVCKIVKELTDVEVNVSRNHNLIDESYTMVGLTIPFRMTTKSKSRSNPECDDYVYFIGIYNS